MDQVQSENIIISVVGKLHSGKTTVADWLQTRLFHDNIVARALKFAAPIYEAINALGQPKHRPFMQQYGDLIKEHFGEKFLAQQAAAEIKKFFAPSEGYMVPSAIFEDTSKVALLDDMRFPFELEELKELCASEGYTFYLIFVDAPDELRKARNEALYSGNEHKSELYISQFKKEASYILDNSGSFKDLHMDLEELYTSLISPSIISAKDEPTELLTVEFKRFANCFELPAYKTEGANGMDIYAAEDVTIPAHDRGKVASGFGLAMPPNYCAVVKARSGLFLKEQVSYDGLIDSDYRGEVHVMMHNDGDMPVYINRGDRIAQLLILPAPRVKVIEVEELSATARGAGGFGHTGMRG